MNCKMFRLQLDNLEPERNAFLLSPPMQAHLESCAACQAHWQLHRRLLAVLENDIAPVLPAEFTAKVLNRIEPAAAPARVKLIFNWQRLLIYAGYAFVLGLALWVGYRNLDLNAIANWQNSALAQQLQQWLASIGASEVLLLLRNFLANSLSLLPTTASLIEKLFGKEVLPKVLNLTMILILTYLVAKVSVFLENWLRQDARRNS